MPRLQGRESSRPTVMLNSAYVAAFALPWEDRVAKRPCCIEGCDHKCGDECSRGNPANITNDPDRMINVGTACPCCTDTLLGMGNQ